jgi:hypothetical protein
VDEEARVQVPVAALHDGPMPFLLDQDLLDLIPAVGAEGAGADAQVVQPLLNNVNGNLAVAQPRVR